MSKLFISFITGTLSLDYRIVTTLLTRLLSEPGNKAETLVREHYSQRTPQDALITSEATPVAREGYAYTGAPSAIQVEGDTYTPDGPQSFSMSQASIVWKSMTRMITPPGPVPV